MSTEGSTINAIAAALLGRTRQPEYAADVQEMVAGKTVLITGAGGSIGGELARQVNSLQPGRLVLLDRDESLLQSIQLDLSGNGLLRGRDLVLASIRDADRIDRVFEAVRPDVVFHAAALKHLPLLESYPHEAVLTNVLGTRNVVAAAVESGAATVVNVSTDKAADPTSVLGASKRIAELITQSHAVGFSRVSSVRFGNVLGSRGSFLPLLMDRMSAGLPVHLTHPEVSRYFMTIPEAAGLVVNAATLGTEGEVFVLDMGTPVKILDLIHNYAELTGLPLPKIVITGLRPGEKLQEVVFSDSEKHIPTEHPSIFRTVPEPLPDDLADRIASFERIHHLTAAEVVDEFARALNNYSPAKTLEGARK